MQYQQERYEEFLAHLPVTASDRTLVVLKGHLLVERALREFIYKRVHKPHRLHQAKQISFAILLDFAVALDDGDSMSWVWESAKQLNKLRNLLAHSLSPQKIDQLEQEFVHHVQAHDGEATVVVDNSLLPYADFPLAIFQVYDRIISYPYFSPAEIAHYNDAIYRAFDSVLASVDDDTSGREDPT